jgi:uncharacterized membrane protein YhaH (DUF805 family)
MQALLHLNPSIMLIVRNIYPVAIIVPSVAVAIRRMHDTGRRGWWILLPIANIVFLCLDGQPGPNQYGPDPKAL